MLALLLALVTAPAHAAPPSSQLTGEDGSLTWTVAPAGDGVKVVGKSPKWTVEHTAGKDLSPRSTRRTDPDGAVTTVAWSADTVTVTLPKGKVVTHKDPAIWDGDTLDIRLGERVRTGKPLELSFQAIDTGSGKVYGFDAVDKGTETCPSGPCRHVNVTLAGWLKLVGPSFDYWYASDGRLVKFEGPAGNFVAR